MPAKDPPPRRAPALRGVVFAVLFSLPFWVLVVLVLWRLW